MGIPAIDIDKLDPAERLLLIGELWESLRSRPAEVPVSQPQIDELNVRLDQLESGQSQTLSWDEVKGRVRRRSA